MKRLWYFSMAILIASTSLFSCSKDDDDLNGGDNYENLTPTSADEFEFEYNSDYTATLVSWKNEVWIRDLWHTGSGDTDFLKEILTNDGKVPQIDGIELRDLVIPSTVKKNGVEYTVTVIDDAAFAEVYNLRSIHLPNTIVKIREDAFAWCLNLQKINIPASVTSISNEFVFEACVSLNSIEVDPSNNTYCSVDGVLFTKDKTNLRYYPCGKKEAYSIPSSVKTIGMTAFTGAIFLPSITWGDNVTTLGSNAFMYCLSIKDLVIKEGIKVITEAFNECLALETVDIPSTVTMLGYESDGHTFEVFNNCENMKSIIIRAQNPPECPGFGWTSFPNPNPVQPTLYVPQGSVQKYKNYEEDGWWHPYAECFGQILPIP